VAEDRQLFFRVATQSACAASEVWNSKLLAHADFHAAAVSLHRGSANLLPADLSRAAPVQPSWPCRFASRFALAPALLICDRVLQAA